MRRLFAAAVEECIHRGADLVCHTLELDRSRPEAFSDADLLGCDEDLDEVALTMAPSGRAAARVVGLVRSVGEVTVDRALPLRRPRHDLNRTTTGTL